MGTATAAIAVTSPISTSTDIATARRCVARRFACTPVSLATSAQKHKPKKHKKPHAHSHGHSHGGDDNLTGATALPLFGLPP